jgi:hypothetical protein
LSEMARFGRILPVSRSFILRMAGTSPEVETVTLR